MLQEQAQKDCKSADFETMLKALRDDFEIRITGGVFSVFYKIIPMSYKRKW